MAGLKWQDGAKILLSLILIGGIVTYTDLFGVLFKLTGVKYSHSGDIYCTETCESYIDVNTSYWNICFEESSVTQGIYIDIGDGRLTKTTIGEYPDTVIYKKWRYGRRLWVNLNNVNNVITTRENNELVNIPVDWQVPTVGAGNWRDLKSGDCWLRKKVNRIKLVGHKEPEQTIKWSFGLESYIDIDPLWIGNVTPQPPPPDKDPELIGPPTYHQFYGVANYVKDTEIVGIVNDFTSTTKVDAGKYGYDPLFLVENGINGAMINFYINGYKVADEIFEDGGVTELNFYTGGGNGGNGGVEPEPEPKPEPKPVPTRTGTSITVNQFTIPSMTKEELNLQITEHNGAIWINNSVFNCVHKVPDYETKAISLSSSIDINKYSILIEEGKYEYDFTEFIKEVKSEEIKELTEEIVCNVTPTVRGCKLDFGKVIFDLCDDRFDITLEQSKKDISMTLVGDDYSKQHPQINITDMTLGNLTNNTWIQIDGMIRLNGTNIALIDTVSCTTLGGYDVDCDDAVYDGDYTNEFRSDNNSNAQNDGFILDFGSSKTISSVVVVMSVEGNPMGEHNLQTSPDNITWTNVSTFNDFGAGGTNTANAFSDNRYGTAGEGVYHYFFDTVEAQYFRLIRYANTGGFNGWMRIAEIEIFTSNKNGTYISEVQNTSDTNNWDVVEFGYIPREGYFNNSKDVITVIDTVNNQTQAGSSDNLFDGVFGPFPTGEWRTGNYVQVNITLDKEYLLYGYHEGFVNGNEPDGTTIVRLSTDNITFTEVSRLSSYARSGYTHIWNVTKARYIQIDYQDSASNGIRFTEAWVMGGPINTTNITIQTKTESEGWVDCAYIDETSCRSASTNSKNITIKASLTTEDEKFSPMLQYLRVNSTVGADTVPTFSTTSINNTSPQTSYVIQAGNKIEDDNGISLGIFSWNDTGGWTNPFNSSYGLQTSFNFTVNLTITAATGEVIGLNFTANDTTNQWASATLRTITVAAADTCSPTCPLSADYTFDCSDECSGVSCDAGGYNILIQGTGSFQGTITNYLDLRVEGTDTSNKCIARVNT